jgi:hypothetical protein
MKITELQELGLKIVGLYCVILGIGEWFDKFPELLNYMNSRHETETTFKVEQWCTLINPVVLFLGGLYLIKDESAVRFFGLCKNVDERQDTSSFLNVGIQLYGALLIAGTISTGISIIIIVVVVSLAPPYLSTSSETDFIKFNILPCVAALSVGSFCLFRSRDLTRLVYRDVSF